MKKFFMFVVLCLMTFSGFAQTIVSSNIYEDTYVSVNGGVFGFIKPNINGYDDFTESLRGTASLRVGKYITPSFGLELDGSVGMANRTTFIDHSNVSLNALFNLNNIFHKYRGTCDRVEFVPFVGVGWLHTYGDVVSNNISGKGGLQINWNIGKERAWQINLRPSITYMLTNNGLGEVSDCKFTANRAFVSAEIGFTYKFKNKKKTHNFVICPKRFTQEEMDAVVDMYHASRKAYENKTQELDNANSKITLLTQECDSLRNREMVVETFANTAIGFEIGSADLLSTSKATLFTLIESIKNENSSILIVGYSDAQTGSDERNMELSEMRVNTIKNILIENGIAATRIEVIAKGSTEQVFEDNDMNRVVTIQVE